MMMSNRNHSMLALEALKIVKDMASKWPADEGGSCAFCKRRADTFPLFYAGVDGEFVAASIERHHDPDCSWIAARRISSSILAEGGEFFPNPNAASPQEPDANG